MSNEKHPISELMDSSLQNLRTLVDADTVVGEAITTPDGTVIIPVSKVSFGFASGGSDIPTIKQAGQFGGGAGGGVSVQPIAFLVIKAFADERQQDARRPHRHHGAGDGR